MTEKDPRKKQEILKNFSKLMNELNRSELELLLSNYEKIIIDGDAKKIPFQKAILNWLMPRRPDLQKYKDLLGYAPLPQAKPKEYFASADTSRREFFASLSKWLGAAVVFLAVLIGSIVPAAGQGMLTQTPPLELAQGNPAYTRWLAVFVGGAVGLALLYLYRRSRAKWGSLQIKYSGDKLPQPVEKQLEGHLRGTPAYRREISKVQVNRKGNQIQFQFHRHAGGIFSLQVTQGTGENFFDFAELDRAFADAARKIWEDRRALLTAAGAAAAGSFAGWRLFRYLTAPPPRIVAIYCYHDTAQDFAEILPYLDRIFKEAKQQGKKIVFVFEWGGRHFSKIKEEAPELADIELSDLISLSPNPEKVTRFKKTYVQQLRNRAASYTKPYLRQTAEKETNPFMRELCQFLLSHEEQLSDVTNEILLNKPENIVEADLLLRRQEIAMQAAAVRIANHQDLPGALAMAKQAAQLLFDAVDWRDSPLVKGIRGLRRGASDDDIVYVRGVTHAYAGILENGLGNQVVSFRSRDVQDVWREIATMAPQYFQNRAVLHSPQMEFLLLRAIVLGTYAKLLEMDSVPKEDRRGKRDELDFFLKPLKREEIEKVLLQVRPLINEAAQRRAPLSEAVLQHVRELRPTPAPQDNRVRSPLARWYTMPMNYVEEYLHYGAAKLIYLFDKQVVADRPVIYSNDAYTRVPFVANNPESWKSALITGIAPLVWILALTTAVLLVFNVREISAFVGLTIAQRFWMAVLIGIPSAVMALAHILTAKNRDADLYRFWYAFKKSVGWRARMERPSPSDRLLSPLPNFSPWRWLGAAVLFFSAACASAPDNPAKQQPAPAPAAAPRPDPKKEKIEGSLVAAAKQTLVNVRDWFPAGPSRDEIVKQLEAFVKEPRVKLVDDSYIVISADPAEKTVIVHPENFTHLLFFEKRAKLLFALAQLLPEQVKLHGEIQTLFAQVPQETAPLLQPDENGEKLRVNFKLATHKEAYRLFKAYMLEMTYVSCAAEHGGTNIEAFLGQLVLIHRTQDLDVKTLMAASCIKNGEIQDEAAFKVLLLMNESPLLRWMKWHRALEATARAEMGPLFDALSEEKQGAFKGEWVKGWIPEFERAKVSHAAGKSKGGKVRSPASGWRWDWLNLVFYPLNLIEEVVHFGVAWGLRKSPVWSEEIMKDSSITVDYVEKNPKSWLTLVIAGVAPAFWFASLRLAFHLRLNMGEPRWFLQPGSSYWAFNFFESVPFAAVWALGFFSALMAFLHVWYSRAPDSDLRRVGYVLQEKLHLPQFIDPPTGNRVRSPVAPIKLAEEVVLPNREEMQTLLRQLLSAASGAELAERFGALPLIAPSEGDRRSTHPKEFYEEVVALGMESDLKGMILAVDIHQVSPELKDKILKWQQELQKEITNSQVEERALQKILDETPRVGKGILKNAPANSPTQIPPGVQILDQDDHRRKQNEAFDVAV